MIQDSVNGLMGLMNKDSRVCFIQFWPRDDDDDDENQHTVDVSLALSDEEEFLCVF